MDIRCLIQYFYNTAHTCHAHRNHDKYHRQHHQAHQDIHTISKKTHQFPCCQGLHYDHLRTKPANQNDTRIYSKHHNRCIPHNIFLCSYENIVNIFAGTLKFTGLLFFSYICFHYADRRYIFLNRRIQRIILWKCLLEICRRMTDNKKQNRSQNQNSHKINAGKSRIDRKRHYHRTDHACRCTHHHAKDHLICILHIGHIRCQTCNQSCCTEMINIRKGIGLNMIKHCISKIFCKSG